MSNLPTLSLRLKELRKKLAVTQKVFANYIGVSAATLSSYETGAKQPSLSVLLVIAQKCQVSLDWLCGIITRNINSEFNNYGDVIEKLVGIAFMFPTQIDCIRFDEDGEGRYLSNEKKSVQFCIDDNDLFGFFEEWKEIKPLFEKGTISKKFYESWLNEKIALYKNMSIKDDDNIFTSDQELPF